MGLFGRSVPYCFLSLAAFYLCIIQPYRVYVYLHSSTPVTYAHAVSIFPKNPISVWSKEYAYRHEPGATLNSPICRKSDQSSLSILVLILSKPERFEARLAIRASWATYFQNKMPKRAAVFFAVGIPSEENGTMKKGLRSEIDHYNDVLVIDMLESYHNLSLKSVAALRWIDSKCKGAALILKVDDDVVIFGRNLMRYLDQYYGGDRSAGANGKLREPTMHCYVYWQSKVARDRMSIKGFVPFEIYPGRHYQPFCSGHAYVFTRTAMQLLVNRTRHLTFYSHLEDVLLTGLLAQDLGIKRISRYEFHGERFSLKHPYPPSDPRWKAAYAKYFSVHYVKKATDLMDIWSGFMAFSGG